MLAYRIRKARMEKGLKQAELAELVGKSRTSIVNWETNYAPPDKNNLENIASSLDVTVDWLLDESNDEIEMLEHGIIFDTDVKESEDQQNTIQKQFGKRIRYMRKRQGLSLSDVGNIVNAHLNTVAGWERGFREPPFEAVLKLCELYKVSPNTLLGWQMNTIDINEFEPWIVEYLSAAETRKSFIRNMWEELKKVKS